MAIITGITVPEVPVAPNVDEEVEVTLELFGRLGLGFVKELVKSQLTDKFAAASSLGAGRLYVKRSAAVTHARQVQLANTLAAERGFAEVYPWSPLWVPGTEQNSLTKLELDGSQADFDVRIALFSDEPNPYECDPLLHFKNLPFDGKYKKRGQSTQEEQIACKREGFVARNPGTFLEPADHDDFLTWYCMDLIRNVPAEDVVLARGFMRVPRFGRRAVGGDSCVGNVYSFDGQALLGGSLGSAHDGYGLGLSTGFIEA